VTNNGSLLLSERKETRSTSVRTYHPRWGKPDISSTGFVNASSREVCGSRCATWPAHTSPWTLRNTPSISMWSPRFTQQTEIKLLPNGRWGIDNCSLCATQGKQEMIIFHDITGLIPWPLIWTTQCIDLISRSLLSQIWVRPSPLTWYRYLSLIINA